MLERIHERFGPVQLTCGCVPWIASAIFGLDVDMTGVRYDAERKYKFEVEEVVKLSESDSRRCINLVLESTFVAFVPADHQPTRSYRINRNHQITQIVAEPSSNVG